MHPLQNFYGNWAQRIRSLWESDNGYSLIYVLFLIVIFSTTLLTMFQLWMIRQGIIRQKEDYLKAKYLAEESFIYTISRLSGDYGMILEMYKNPDELRTDSLAFHRKAISVFGGYLHAEVKSKRKNQSFQLRALVGQKFTPDFRYAIVSNPIHPALILAGGASIRGNVLTGSQGVKTGRIENMPCNRLPKVYGRVIAGNKDGRPLIDYSMVHHLFGFFTRCLESTNLLELNDYLMGGKQPGGSRFSGSLSIVFVSNKELNRPGLQLSGPAVFIVHEPLFLSAPIRISNRAMILSDHEIEINGQLDIKESILFSTEAISITNVKKLEMQVFSRTSITVAENVQLDYPSLLMVFTQNDSGSIRLAKRAEVNGSLFYLSDLDSLSGNNNRGQIIVDEQGRVNGVIYSNNLTALRGIVNGIVITDQFYLYQSPLVYFNWIFGAVVDRNKLTNEFTLPLFFKEHLLELKPVFFQ